MTSIPCPIIDHAPSPFPGLSPAQLAEIEQARKRSRKVRRAAMVAITDAWISAVFAAVTALSAVFSPSSLLLAAPLAVITFNSFRGARRMRSFDAGAGKLLALNQLALAAVLIVYAACSLWSASHNSESLSLVHTEPALAPYLGSIDRLCRLVSLAIYGGLILGTVLAQGLAAIYYATRGKHIRAYLAATPTWIVDLQKVQAGG